ncbi:RES family NAD+ phosphorylase [Methylobacterium oryzae]|uniref:RES domain-containing protein n=1 Tax=Methylobacterium oryzae TaxID=334852 RepID=A0ABU7TT65_9HYPH
MSRSLWRIAADTPAYTADDMTGAGSEKTGGRWNAAGTPVTYSSTSRGLACLETVVHLNSGGLPLNRYLVEIEVPDPIWNAAQRETVATLAVGWDAEPAGKVSIDFGTNWLGRKSSALLVIPSVIIPEEFNVLINPLHSDASSITAQKVRKWTYDPRLIKK